MFDERNSIDVVLKRLEQLERQHRRFMEVTFSAVPRARCSSRSAWPRPPARRGRAKSIEAEQFVLKGPDAVCDLRQARPLPGGGPGLARSTPMGSRAHRSDRTAKRRPNDRPCSTDQGDASGLELEAGKETSSPAAWRSRRQARHLRRHEQGNDEPFIVIRDGAWVNRARVLGPTRLA